MIYSKEPIHGNELNSLLGY